MLDLGPGGGLGAHWCNGLLSPIATDRAAATERVLKIISCGCKVAAERNATATKQVYFAPQCVHHGVGKPVRTQHE